MDSSCHATLQQAHLQLVFHAAVLVLSRKARAIDSSRLPQIESLLGGKRLRERLQPRSQERRWDRGCGKLISRFPYENDGVLTSYSGSTLMVGF